MDPLDSDQHDDLQLHSQWKKWNIGTISYPELTNPDSLKWNSMAKAFFTDLKKCPDVAECILQNQQELNMFLKKIEKTKSHNILLSASEISYTYRNKVILILDNEPETLKKADDEYGEDPYFSTKVNMTCLDSGSCSSMVNSGTVLKIIGSNSEDGNTLSGYSAHNLASLILQLQNASLFSITGNTSSTFQNNFIRVFTGLTLISPVLETTIQNDHIYKMIDDTGTSVEYQVPKISVDHTTQYDKQHILIMQDDPIVRDAATFLYEKHPAVSSVYILENQRPKLIKGDPSPLSEESRLYLVGHGKEGRDGKMELAGYKAEEVAEIIEHINIEENQIKTVSVVACELGLDEAFGSTLIKELHARSITTELHLRSSLLQVGHSGQKLTGEITADGLVWKHKDDNKKVVFKVDVNGEPVTQVRSGNSGEVVYFNERSILGGESWPKEPKEFVSSAFRQPHTDDLEGLAWAFFQDREENIEQSMHTHVRDNSLFTINDLQLEWDNENRKYIRQDFWYTSENNNEIQKILEKCYEIKSGEDILNAITRFAAVKENYPTYLMINDWIYKVFPKKLYVFPVGKKLNEGETVDNIKNIIINQENSHAYPDIRKGIEECEGTKYYAQYARESLQGIYKTGTPQLHLSLNQEAWLSTMFIASVISESSRNFRSFPITLMAMDMTLNQNLDRAQEGLEFLFQKHPMTKGETWINTDSRGFYGSIKPENLGGPVETGGKKTKKQQKKEERRAEMLERLTKEEEEIVKQWITTNGKNEIDTEMLQKLLVLVHGKDKLNVEDQNTGKTIISVFEDSYKHFKSNKNSRPSTSGPLGGSHDGATTLQDVVSAADVESSLKLSSYYSRTSALLSEHIHSELQGTFGEKVQEYHVKSDSIMIQNGEFHCELVSGTNPHEIKKWKLKLPEECKIQLEKIWKKIEKVSEMTTTHTTSGHLERAGMAIGTMGLLLGAQGAVHAFEQGDTISGTIATVQTVHGVTGMSMAALGKHVSVAAEGKVMKAISTAVKNPVTKRALAVFPIVGAGFGIYNVVEDVKRGDTLGKIDATLDSLIVALDIVELAVPELEVANLALNAIRMVFDDIYLDTQAELNKLPPEATLLDKIGACFRGVGIGALHFMFDVASLFVTIPYRDIEQGHMIVKQISDYHKYYSQAEVQAGRKAIDFTGGESSWNGGGITFCLSDDRNSKMCMDYFVSADESTGEKCWTIDTSETDDIVLGTGESHQLIYSNIEIKIFLFIPVGSIKVPSGYEAMTNSRYGKYSGNNKANNFFAVQKNNDSHQMEVMLHYYYELYGKAGSDSFYLGPQRSYVKGQGGSDKYIIPEDGGNTIIDNYDPLKETDLLMLSINYDQISVTKSENDVILQFCNNHHVRIKNWFAGETYRHLNMMSADGVLFDISTVVISSVKLVAIGVNMMLKPEGQTVNTTQPLLNSVTNIMGSRHNDWLIGNAQKNLINGGGEQDYMWGGEGEDIYVVNEKNNSTVEIENYSRDKEIDMIIIEANLHDFKTKVEGNNLTFMPFSDFRFVKLINWFRSEEDRHLLVVTKDLITFSLSANKTLCNQSDPIHSKCILSQTIDYSKSMNPLVIDLETDDAFLNVTDVRGSNLNDVIKGNAQGNIFYPWNGTDFLQGRGGQDLYIITPGYGLKTIDNFSPDLAPDTLFLNADYELIAVKCFGLNLILLVNGKEEVHLKAWFNSQFSQHLQVRTSDGIIFRLQLNISKCIDGMKIPQSVDYRNRESNQTMQMNSGEFVSVKEMYGSCGFDFMRANDKDNLLDPFTGGGSMMGGEGKDTYIVKTEYSGTQIMIDNFATDEKEDTVLFQADFLSTPFTVYGENYDVIISAKNKGQNMMVRLLEYRAGRKHQHLSFQSADGVHFWVRSSITNRSEDHQNPWIEAYKVILKDKQLDCNIDLSSQNNLSTVYTVEGCSYQSNHIQGNDLDNALFGGMKPDVLDGGDGHDILIGGQGNDILLGGRGNDTLYGEEGDDTLMGGSGWDSFIPGPGADVMDGGPGRDTVLYQGDHGKGEGVSVSLLSGEGHQADAEGDVLKDVENVIGTIYSDILVSGYEPALLKGSDGDDVLVSAAEGDYLIGGEGRDIYMVVPHHGWITIDNCAEDNATDVLYLPSVKEGYAECKESPSGLYLKFPLTDNTFMGIFLKDWVNNSHKCGHLILLVPENIVMDGQASD